MVTRAWSASDQSHCWRGAPACWSDRSTDDPGPGADESGANKHKQTSYLETIEVYQPPTLCQNCARQVGTSVIEIPDKYEEKINIER